MKDGRRAKEMGGRVMESHNSLANVSQKPQVTDPHSALVVIDLCFGCFYFFVYFIFFLRALLVHSVCMCAMSL